MSVILASLRGGKGNLLYIYC